MKTLCLFITLICTTSALASIQVNNRMDRPVGDFDEDQAYGEVVSNRSPDLSLSSINIFENYSTQIDYLNPPVFATPPNPTPPPADTFIAPPPSTTPPTDDFQGG